MPSIAGSSARFCAAIGFRASTGRTGLYAAESFLRGALPRGEPSATRSAAAEPSSLAA